MARRYPEPEPAKVYGSAWAAPPGRFPEDDALRAFGFTIAERKGTQEPRWRYRREVFVHSEAMDIVDALAFGGREEKCRGR